MRHSPYLLNLKIQSEPKASARNRQGSGWSYVFFALSLGCLALLVSVVWYLPDFTTFTRLSRSTSALAPHVPAALSFLGYPTPKRYLFLLENSNELRPTGGFIGSYGVLELHRGRITKFNIPTDGTYGLQWQTPTIAPPRPLELVNKRFEMQDANWWPDFPTSARAALAFWQAGNVENVDGVIAITNRFIAGVLQTSGPMALPDSSLVLTANNLSSLLQASGPTDWASAAAPRQFLSTVARPMVAHLINYARQEPLKAAHLILEGMAQKDIQIYSANPALADLAKTLGADGRFPPFEDDGLGVVFANIGGGKTDNDIATKVEVHSQIDQNFRYHTLLISRTSSTFEINRSYLRIYLPLESRINDVSGFSSSEEGAALPQWKSEGKFSVLEGWTNLDPHEEATIRVSYVSPSRPSGEFGFRFLRQAGLSKLRFTHEITSSKPFFLETIRPRDIKRTKAGTVTKIEAENPPDLTYKFARRVEADI